MTVPPCVIFLLDSYQKRIKLQEGASTLYGVPPPPKTSLQFHFLHSSHDGSIVRRLPLLRR